MKEVIRNVFTIILLLIGAFSLPLSVIAWMRWFEIPWWIASIVVFTLSPGIPFYAGAGLFFLFQSNFDVQEAIHARARSENARSFKPTTEEELVIMRAALFPRLKQTCISSFSKKEPWTKLVVAAPETYCYCYATSGLKAITLEEIEFQNKNGNSSPAYDRAVQKAAILCNKE